MFQIKTYISRRAQLKKSVGDGIILLPGNEEVGMNYASNVYQFRQDSTFLYFFGLDKPGLTGVIDVDNDRDYIFGDDPTIDEIVWTGPQTKLAELAETTGVAEIDSTSDLSDFIDRAIKANRQIHYLIPYRYRNLGKVSSYLNKKPDWVRKNASIKLVEAVVAQRSIKDEEEMVEIEKAVEITAWMHLRAMDYAQAGMLEKEVAAELNKIAHEAGPGLSFPSIVTVRGEVLHNQYFGNTLREGQLLLVDAGAESSMHYAGDMSRTFPISPKFSQKQKDIYQIGLDAQKAAISLLKPGNRYLDAHLAAAKTIASGMKSLGLMMGDVEEAVSAGAHALFFQCGTGHMMGLDVHDMENLGEEYVGYDDSLQKSTQFGLNYLRLGRELKPGFVVTVEPGIYFIPTLIDLWKQENKFSEFINYNKVEKYRDFGGLRAEDDFVITDDGARLLGPRVPKEIDEIENVRSNSLKF